MQGFFEGLVNTITQALAPVIQAVTDAVLPVINNVSTAVWNALPSWIRDGLLFLHDLVGQAWTALWNFVRDPVGSIQAGLSWVTDIVHGWAIWVRDQVSNGLGVVTDVVHGWAVWVRDQATKSFSWLGSHVTSGLTQLFNDISGSLGSFSTTISGAFTGALSTFGGWVTDAMAAVAGALGVALQGMITWLSAEIPKAVAVVVQFAQAHIINPIVDAFQWVFDRLGDIARGLINTIQDMFGHHSPIEPRDALNIGIMATVAAVVSGGLATTLIDAAGTKVLGTGLDLKSLGRYVTEVINPGMFMGAVLGVLVGVGVKTPVTQFYNKLFRPQIPAIAEAQQMLWRGKITMGQFRDIVARTGYGALYEDAFVELTKQLPGPGDLIRFVVREVIRPAIFDKFMVMQGFSIEIAGWFWEAHWILPGRAEIVDAFHRGVITAAERDTYMVLHDFNPEPRPGIRISDQAIVAKIAKRLIPRVDLRRGYRIGQLTKKDLDERYSLLGYEEDAPLMTDIQVGLAFEAERNKLRNNARADLVKGYITEDVMRADLTELGFSAEAINYFVADAKADRERKQKDLLLDEWEDGYVKDLVNDAELRARAAAIIVDPAGLELFLRRAFVRKFRKPKEVTPKAAPKLPLGTLTRAFRDAVIAEDKFRAELARRDFSTANIDIIVAVEKARMA